VQRGVGPQLFGSSYGSAKISGTVPAANGTALWERYPTRGFFSQARKEDSNIAGTLGWTRNLVKGPEVHSV